MFEYFAVRKPILYLGPNGTAAQAIKNSGHGLCVHDQSVEAIKKELLEFMRRIKTHDFNANNEYTEAFEVRKVLGRFIKDIDDALASRSKSLPKNASL